jgi:KDO2-lipid IV(A) lauroyltransferase
MQAGCFVARLLPRQYLYHFSDLLAVAGFYLFRGFRRRSIRNVQIALRQDFDGAVVQRIVRRSLQNFFRDFVEIVTALVTPSNRLRSEIPVIGREHLDAALAKGNGVIVISAHLGNFFLLGTRLALEGYPVHVLVNQPKNGHFAKLMDEYRLKVRQNTIHARPRRDASHELVQVLRRNELAVLIADEHRRGAGISVPFFGRTVQARRGPATLALRTGAAVVPAYLVRNGKSHLQLIIEPELKLVRAARNKPEIRENTLLITQWLESAVRAYPDQWNWMNIHWLGHAESSLRANEQSVQRASY